MFEMQQKVMFHHCDPAGIVFYPRYFEMVNIVVERWFDICLDTPFERLHGEMNAAVPTVALTTRFQNASRHGDLLDFTLKLKTVGRSSVTIDIVACCDRERRLTLEATLVFIDKATGRSARWPQGLHEKLSGQLDSETPTYA